MDPSWMISSRPLSPHLHSTPAKCSPAISTAAVADPCAENVNSKIQNNRWWDWKKSEQQWKNGITWLRLQMALRWKRWEISASLGMYTVFTKIPAPRIAIWGTFVAITTIQQQQHTNFTICYKTHWKVCDQISPCFLFFFLFLLSLFLLSCES